MWDDLGRGDAESFFPSAKYRAVTSEVANRANESTAGEKAGAAEADRAMESLRKAVAAGFRDAGRMTNSADFDALRDRAGFRKLLAKLNG
jgi:hypothetical protein